MKSKILLNCVKGKYGYHLGESSNTSVVLNGAERVTFAPKPAYSKCCSKVSNVKIYRKVIGNSALCSSLLQISVAATASNLST